VEITIVGDFDWDQMEKIIPSTFGALPKRAVTKERFEDRRQVQWPSRPQTNTYYFESELDKGLVQVVWPTEDSWNFDNVRRLTVLKDVLGNRLLFEIRQAMGDTYSPQVQCVHSETFKDRGALAATVSVDPAKAVLLADKIVAIAQDIAQGITPDECSRAVNPLITETKTFLITNEYWMTTLWNSQEYPQKLTWPSRYLKAYESIQCQDLQDLARRYLSAQNALKSIILPRPSEPH
jgi:zinc protease